MTADDKWLADHFSVISVGAPAETYSIIRFYADSEHSEHRSVIREGLTLAEARAHCQRDDTSEAGVWFDGFEADDD